MKIFISMILALGISAQAIAQNSTVCSNGTVDEVGDSHLMIEIPKSDDAIRVNFYEASSSIPKKDVEKKEESDGFSYSIKEGEYETFGEGNTYTLFLSGSFFLDKDETRLTGRLVINKEHERELNLNCQKESGGK